ncbi:adenosylcobalamin-dependent ribonucleoside-diphosphate reductase [Candidatus Pacearchaeota archaeon]|nr:adenosylcobalamin-dependent ribonucleoside-diphosphate reductase [Candidatus Pacearchaeota archaeon]
MGDGDQYQEKGLAPLGQYADSNSKTGTELFEAGDSIELNKKGLQDNGTIKIGRYFSKGGIPYYKHNWTKSDVDINDETGRILFTQKGVEFPERYSELSRQIVASRYFYGEVETAEREYSLRQLIERVTTAISEWGVQDGYFTTEEGEIFKNELAALVLDQYVSFNSPVWFNVGTDKYPSRKSGEQRNFYIIKDGKAVLVPGGEDHLYPQTSACFIQNVGDTMEDIMDLAKREAALFKYGSGTGTDLSTLRSSREKLSGGGKPSGPIAYLTFYDRVAGIVKSGGKTRRAAKMNSLKITHPDVFEFITAKMREEEKARALMRIGYSAREAAETVAFQNANLSVRLTDDFMEAVNIDGEWQTIPVHNHEMADKMPKYSARALMRAIALGAWQCGDPGVQYHTIINRWNTCAGSFEINSSNPCSEYMFCDNSSCNLASHNLRRYLNPDGSFDLKSFEKATRLISIAQDLLYDHSGFPREEIAENSHKFRPLGQGYSNAGALIMSLGLPYDSDEGRTLMASLTALLNANVYKTSAEMARILGPFEEFPSNRESMLNVMRMHRDALNNVDSEKIPEGFEYILERAFEISDEVVRDGEKYGFRNAQATVLAPTGTISFMMGCDTTGIEPEVFLVKYKHLAEGGSLRIVNKTVSEALKRLEYNKEQIKDILEHIGGHENVTETPYLKSDHQGWLEKLKDDHFIDNRGLEEKIVEKGYSPQQAREIRLYLRGHEIIEGSPYLKEEHLPVFDCSLKPNNGTRVISHMGHLKMMAAVQPFISGAISKTVNLPKETTPEQIEEIYQWGWKKGLKSLALYREGSKVWQVYEAGSDEIQEKSKRIEIPETSFSVTQRFNIANHEGEVVVGFYPGTGRPGRVTFRMQKEGKTIGGLLGLLGTSMSIGLQHGVPLKAYTDKLINQRFEPYGIVFQGKISEKLNTVKSIGDYLGKALPILSERGLKAVGFLKHQELLGTNGSCDKEAELIQRRVKLPKVVPTIRQKFNIQGQDGSMNEGYMQIGFYPDTGKPGEIFFTMSKEGATIGGLLGSLGTSMSIGLQHGVPWEDYSREFTNQRFEPYGKVQEGNIGSGMDEVQSIGDYIGRALPVIASWGEEMVRELRLSNFSFAETTYRELGDKNQDSIETEKLREPLTFCPSCQGPLPESPKGCMRVCSCGYIDQSGCGG